jgi:antitoxin PrlF
MKEYVSSVSPKGQITIPIEIRKRLGVEPRDKVVFLVEGDEVKIVPITSSLEAGFQAFPALERPLSTEDMAAIAWEEHAQEIAREGL